MAAHSSILAWETHGRRSLASLSMRLQSQKCEHACTHMHLTAQSLDIKKSFLSCFLLLTINASIFKKGKNYLSVFFLGYFYSKFLYISLVKFVICPFFFGSAFANKALLSDSRFRLLNHSTTHFFLYK